MYDVWNYFVHYNYHLELFTLTIARLFVQIWIEMRFTLNKDWNNIYCLVKRILKRYFLDTIYTYIFVGLHFCNGLKCILLGLICMYVYVYIINMQTSLVALTRISVLYTFLIVNQSNESNYMRLCLIDHKMLSMGCEIGLISK